jgi:hypothetical protein
VSERFAALLPLGTKAAVLLQPWRIAIAGNRNATLRWQRNDGRDVVLIQLCARHVLASRQHQHRHTH